MCKDRGHWEFVCLPFSCFETRKSQVKRKTNRARSSFVSPIISGDLRLAARRSECVEEIRGIRRWRPRSAGRVATHLGNCPVSRRGASRGPSGHDLRGDDEEEEEKRRRNRIRDIGDARARLMPDSRILDDEILHMGRKEGRIYQLRFSRRSPLCSEYILPS